MEFNPFLPEVKENPYPYYRYLRDHAPVHQVKDLGYWVLTRYDDVLYALKNPHLFSSSTSMAALLGELNPFYAEAPVIIGSDPPLHSRLRKLVNRAFTPRRIASLEAHMHEMVHSLLDRAAAEGEFDLTRDLAIPLPVMVIAELLGIPPERYREFRRWADAVIQGSNGGTAMSPEMRAEIRQNIGELRAYFEEAIADYRRLPSDNLISDLVRAEEEDQVLTGTEVLNMAIIVMLGGSETTTNLLGNAMLALLNNPEQLA
ncbi:MAG: cytochrome P450, partial [Candidatus Binatia bacterium]